jgi:hypothetical protein
VKQFVLKQGDLDHLLHLIKHRHIALLDNGDKETHRNQAREQYVEIVSDWVKEVER